MAWRETENKIPCLPLRECEQNFQESKDKRCKSEVSMGNRVQEVLTHVA